jgi:hypothetical protein
MSFSDTYKEKCYCIPLGGTTVKAVFGFISLFEELLQQVYIIILVFFLFKLLIVYYHFCNSDICSWLVKALSYLWIFPIRLNVVKKTRCNIKKFYKFKQSIKNKISLTGQIYKCMPFARSGTNKDFSISSAWIWFNIWIYII